MRDHCLFLPSAITAEQREDDVVVTVGRGIAMQTVDATCDADPVAMRDMIGLHGVGIADRVRLLCGKVAALPVGDIEERAGGVTRTSQCKFLQES